MTRLSPSNHPQESLSTIPADVISMVQNMYKDQAEEVIGRLEKMDTGVRKVVMSAIIGTHLAMEKNEAMLGEVFEA